MERDPRLEGPQMAELVRQARDGDAGSFCALYKSVYLDLYRFAFYTMKHQQDAEDAVSEAVIKAFEKIATLKKEESFKTWMFQIVINCCRRKLRQNRQGMTEGKEELLCRQEDKAGRGEQMGQDPALSLTLWEALGRLSDEERMIIALSVFGGYKSGEIGEQLKLSASTVRSKLRRGLGKMRDYLGEEDEQ